MDPFADLPKRHFGVILADPPWQYRTWDNRKSIPSGRKYGDASAAIHYDTMSVCDIGSLPVTDLVISDCVLFLWATWPNLTDAFDVISIWGFEYKTCAFCWTKAHATQVELFQDDIKGSLGMGYWTRANTEPCLLATRGKPKRKSAAVRQAIIEPRREHSRKPDCVHERIEQLVDGPYLELFSRRQRKGWVMWGNEVSKFTEAL